MGQDGGSGLARKIQVAAARTSGDHHCRRASAACAYGPGSGCILR